MERTVFVPAMKKLIKKIFKKYFEEERSMSVDTFFMERLHQTGIKTDVLFTDTDGTVYLVKIEFEK